MLDHYLERVSVPNWVIPAIGLIVATLEFLTGSLPEFFPEAGWSMLAVAVANFAIRWVAWYQSQQPMPLPEWTGNVTPQSAPAIPEPMPWYTLIWW